MEVLLTTIVCGALHLWRTSRLRRQWKTEADDLAALAAKRAIQAEHHRRLRMEGDG